MLLQTPGITGPQHPGLILQSSVYLLCEAFTSPLFPIVPSRFAALRQLSSFVYVFAPLLEGSNLRVIDYVLPIFAFSMLLRYPWLPHIRAQCVGLGQVAASP